MLIDEYLVKFGLAADVGKAAQFRKELTGIGAAAKGAVLAVTGALAGIAAVITTAVESTATIGELARRTGTSAEFLQELGYVAEQSGSSVDAARSSVESFSRMVGEAANGVGRGALVFRKFGLEAKNSDGSVKSLDEILGQVSARMQGMNVQQQAAFLARLRIDPTMRQTLLLTADAYQDLATQARAWGITSNEQTEVAMRLSDRFKDLRFGLNALRTQIGLAFMPQLENVIDGLKTWLQANHNLVQQGLTRLFTAIGYAGQAILHVIQFIDEVVSKTVGWKVALGILTLAVLALNRALFMNPLVWIIAAIGLLVLAIDDLMTYLHGGQSFLGEFWDPFILGMTGAWQDLTEKVKAINAAFEFVFDIIVDLATAAFELIGIALTFLETSFKNFFASLKTLAKGDLEGFVKIWKDQLQAIEDFCKGIFESIAKMIDNTLGRAMGFAGTIMRGGSFSDALAAARSVVRNTGYQTPEQLAAQGGQRLAGETGPSAIDTARENNIRDRTFAPMGYGGTAPPRTVDQYRTQTNNINQNVNVNIHSTNPDAAGNAVADRLKNTARQATANLGSPVTQ